MLVPDLGMLMIGSFYVALVLAALSIALGWRVVLRRSTGRWDRGIMLLATTSFVWFLAMWFVPGIAPSYSDLRFGTIYGNLAVMSPAAVLSLFRSHAGRRYLVVSTWMLVCLWFYVMVVSSAV